MMQQTVFGQEPSHNLSTQSRTVAFIAICLFALAGLISGFAIGAFVPVPRAQQVNTPPHIITPVIAGQAQTATPTPHVQHLEKLGWPLILQRPSNTEVADDSTTYTISIQAVDQSIDAAHGEPVHASTISSKIWLTKDGHVSQNMPKDRLRSINTLSDSFPKEEQNSLDFYDPATRQMQLTNSKGRATWNYKLSTSLDPGIYYLVVLTDWQGLNANWDWIEIQVTK